jgi:hypothetical protein
MIAAVKFIPKLVKFGIIGLVLVSLNGKVTQAQRAEQDDGLIDLLSLGCSTSGEGRLFTENREDVSVGKQIFTPAFFVGDLFSHNNPFLLTCKLTPSEQPKTLQLMIGVKDYAMQEEHEITFNVYLDGQTTASYKLVAGEGKTILLDVTKTNSVALEAICSLGGFSGTYCPVLYFLQASILPSPTSSLTNSNSTAFNNTENNDPFNNNGQTVNPPLEESSWGNSTVGEEETESNNSNTSNNTINDINETVDDIESIIDIFK